MKPVVLVCTEYYLPGFKGGGPIRTIANLVERLGEEYEFRILARDRDLGDSEPYPDIAYDCFMPVAGAQVRYLKPGDFRPDRLSRIIRAVPYDLIYLNSFFSPRASLLPLALRLVAAIPRRPVILAPRGEFAVDALARRPWRKRALLAASRITGLHRGINWQASSPFEAEDIALHRPSTKGMIIVAPNMMRSAASGGSYVARDPGDPLRIVFAGRIVPIKNLSFVLEVLAAAAVPACLTVCGPFEDREYWEDCQALIAELPPCVTVDVRGAVPPDDLLFEYARNDLMFLPTKGENFGQVIAEALLCGCPVLVSDRTPWRDLAERGLGSDLPLDRPDLFAAEIVRRQARSSADDHAERRAISAKAVELSTSKDAVNATRDLFLSAVADKRRA